MNYKILIILIIVVILGACGFFSYKYFLKGEAPFGQNLGEKQSAPSDSQTNETLPQAPQGSVSVYKGFWMPCGFFPDYKCQTMSSPEDLMSAGANIASIAPNVKINSRGEVKFDTPADYIEQSLAYWAKKYYENNIRISLAIEVTYQDEFTEGPSGEPQPIPRDISSNPDFLTKYNEIVADIAKLAEKYQVEIFSPMNEPDLKLGEKTANTWAQEILPIIKQNYSGKILWKAAGGALDKYDTDFKGYDIIGFDPSPGGGPFEQSMTNYRQVLNNLLSIAQSRATRDNVSEIMVTEFGVWGGALSFTEEQKVLAHRMVFEIAQGKVSGFFVLDPPTDLDRGLKGTQTLQEIKTWFNEKL